MRLEVRELLERYAHLHSALHKTWGEAKNSPTYNKRAFCDLDMYISGKYRDMLRSLGYDGPLIGYAD